MSETSERINYLMKQAGLKSFAEAARKYGIGYEVFKKIASHNATEQRNLTAEQAILIANYHKVSPGWLMFNEGRPGSVKGIPLEGKIGAGQEMMVYESPGNEDPVPTDIVGVDATALEVEGDSMRPLARDGDIVFVGPPRRNIDSLIGEECAVLLEDGRRFFKVIEHGSQKGRYDLVSHNAATIRNVEVHSAGPLLAIKRRSNSRVTTRRRR
jgi:SOS-response transcriptional repressor LexA